MGYRAWPGRYREAVRASLIVGVLAAAFASAAVAAPRSPTCSAARLSANLPAQKLPAAVAAVRQRIASAAVACDFEKLERIGKEKGGFAFTFGGAKSAAAHWRAQEAGGAKPLATLVKILGLPVTRNEVGAYAWPSAYTAHPKAADWNALVRAGVLTRAKATKAQQSDNVYYGYRTAITRTGDWQFFVAGD
jgi:hypothetical protein